MVFAAMSTFAKFDVDSLIESFDDDTSKVVFEMKTKWRSNYKMSDMEGAAYPDFSKITWVMNTKKGTGIMMDETESITSIYKITDAKWETLNNKTIITMWMESNVGNHYFCILNELNKSLIMTGDIDHIVIRRFYDVN